jgi:hypothetical protein
LEISRGRASFDPKLDGLARFVREVAEKRGHVSAAATDAFLATGWSQANLVDAIMSLATSRSATTCTARRRYRSTFRRPRGCRGDEGVPLCPAQCSFSRLFRQDDQLHLGLCSEVKNRQLITPSFMQRRKRSRCLCAGQAFARPQKETAPMCDCRRSSGIQHRSRSRLAIAMTVLASRRSCNFPLPKIRLT